jgi:lysophospholipase L1-like esterase
VAGDSAAAGVGAPHQEQALAGQLVQQLSQSHRTHWTLEARTGATTGTTLRRMSRLGDVTFDHVITSLGVNDVLAGLSLRAWRDSQRRLRELLRESFGGPRLIVCGLPPVSGFPALPQPLRWYLGRRSKEFDRVFAKDLESEPDATYLPLDFAMDVSLMADDGFHPGPEIYRQWARQVAAVIRGSVAFSASS